MSSNRQETVADIVREMRKRAQEVYEGQTGYPESWEDQMNDDEIREIADRIKAAYKREIETIRALVEGLLKSASIDCASCGYDCGARKENCIIKQAIAYLEGHS